MTDLYQESVDIDVAADAMLALISVGIPPGRRISLDRAVLL
jgi:hypothetical protein